MANPGLREFQALAKLARENGIDPNGMNAEALHEALAHANIEHDAPKYLTPPVKKGFASWSPVQKLNVTERADGYRYRWCDSDPANIDKKRAEGWVFVNKSTGLPGEHEKREHPSDGAALDTAKKYRELVLMALPEERAQERDAYFADQSQKQVLGLKADAERQHTQTAKGVNSARPLHGTIVIS